MRAATVSCAFGAISAERRMFANTMSVLSAVERATIVCSRSASEPTTVSARIPIAIPATVKNVRAGRDARSRSAVTEPSSR